MISEPDRAAASTTTVIPASAAITRLRAGKLQRQGVEPGGSSEITAPVSATCRQSAAVRGRIGGVGTAAEHRDRRAARVERAAMGAGVDPEGEAADHDQARRRELAAEVARHLAAVGGRAARADDRHRRLRLEVASSSAGSPRPISAQGASAASRSPGG